MIWLLGPLVGIAVVVLGLRWAMRSHQRERQPWLDLLAVSAADAAASGGVGAIDGVASDGAGAIPPTPAPFTGRPCLGFHIEIITQETYGNQTTWHRAFEDGYGALQLVGPDGAVRANVDLESAGVMFPTQLTAYTKLSLVHTPETIFHGPLNAMPPHLVGFVQRLPAEVQELVFRPGQQLFQGGKRVYFNERIIVPGQPVVVAGPCVPGPHGVHLGPTDNDAVSFASGSLASERQRIAKLPVLDEAFGAVMAGVIATAVVEGIVAFATK